MNNKKKILLSAILTIIVCLTLITGSTFAIFTSEAPINVAVGSGKVEVVATAHTFTTSSAKYDETIADYVDEPNAGLVFATLGEVTVNTDGNDIDVVNMAPGDAVYFKIDVTNNSTIAIKYQVEISTQQDSDFFDMLEITVGNQVFSGDTITEAWTEWNTTGTTTIDVCIKLPVTVGNEGASKSVNFVYRVNAVQANAYTGV